MAKSQPSQPKQPQRPPVRQVYPLPANRPVNERLIGEVQKGQRPPTQTK